MTAELAVVDASIETSRNDLAGLLATVRALGDPADVQEARARVEAAKGWAKVHGQAKALRLDLLAVEVEALVRLVELDAGDMLTPRDRKAAEYLAAMSASEREAFVRKSENATTACGMCEVVWRQERWEAETTRERARGRWMAQEPPAGSDAEMRAAKSRVRDVSAALANILDDYTVEGEPFTIADLADEVLAEAAYDRDDMDDAVRQGVREVCRQAIRTAPVMHVDGTALPKVITARVGDGYLRIPVANATLAHFDSMLELRREQLRQDQAALDRLEAMYARLLEMANGAKRIGDIVARSVTTAQAGAA